MSPECKTCKTCGLNLPIDDFPVQRDQRRGKEYRRAHCSECWKKQPHKRTDYRQAERARSAARQGRRYTATGRKGNPYRRQKTVRELQVMLCLEAHRAWREWIATKASDDDVARHYADKPWKNPRLSEAEKYKARANADPAFCLAHRMRRRLRKALRGACRQGTFHALFGYSTNTLRAHIESQFTDGMGWHNMGRWHIDHIVPVISFDQQDPEQFARCWALSNLRPCGRRTT